MLVYRNSIRLLIILLIPVSASSQETLDTLNQKIKEVHIKSYFTSQPIIEATSSGNVIHNTVLTPQLPTSLLPAINSAPGVRMEERSPGSYRLALRGSMIRSPFGVRNTKIYLDEIPFTDAGGNTYFNLLDPIGIHQIQILKGPDGSLFGPNSGGVIHVTPNGFDSEQSTASLQLAGGSFGLFSEQLHLKQVVNKNYQFAVDQAWVRSDGYRDHTDLNKLFLQTAHQWQYHSKASLRLLALYTDLDYQTPGGLTQAQFDENPRQARPSTPTIPGSIEQQAGIINRTFLSGITHQYQFSEKLAHSITLFTNLTHFENPFITNYEQRKERNIGFRTYFSYTDTDRKDFHWQMQLGAEGQKGRYQIDNYDNEGGERKDPQSKDKLANNQHFYFYRAMIRLLEKLTIEGSIGLNFNNISFEQHYPLLANDHGKVHFGHTWMPRIATSYRFHPQFAWRASISKGYSPPTIAEVRSSDNQINSELRPETGINYETGIRAETGNRRWIADFSIYHYQMQDGIVRQLREGGAEYFVNAGQITQNGIEGLLMSHLILPRQDHFVQSLYFSTSLTYQDYKFRRYVVGENDFSGNKVTSIPDWIWVNTLAIGFHKNLSVNIMHNYTSTIPLNDGNTVYAEKYHLVQAKLHWSTKLSSQWRINFFTGVDNLLNEKYSLGNDINAFGGRYFNIAPSRNYYLGMKISK